MAVVCHLQKLLRIARLGLTWNGSVGGDTDYSYPAHYARGTLRPPLLSRRKVSRARFSEPGQSRLKRASRRDLTGLLSARYRLWRLYGFDRLDERQRLVTRVMIVI